jgi:hypothetical protein
MAETPLQRNPQFRHLFTFYINLLLMLHGHFCSLVLTLSSSTAPRPTRYQDHYDGGQAIREATRNVSQVRQLLNFLYTNENLWLTLQDTISPRASTSSSVRKEALHCPSRDCHSVIRVLQTHALISLKQRPSASHGLERSQPRGFLELPTACLHQQTCSAER